MRIERDVPNPTRWLEGPFWADHNGRPIRQVILEIETAAAANPRVPSHSTNNLPKRRAARDKAELVGNAGAVQRVNRGRHVRAVEGNGIEMCAGGSGIRRRYCVGTGRATYRENGEADRPAVRRVRTFQDGVHGRISTEDKKVATESLLRLKASARHYFGAMCPPRRCATHQRLGRVKRLWGRRPAAGGARRRGRGRRACRGPPARPTGAARRPACRRRCPRRRRAG